MKITLSSVRRQAGSTILLAIAVLGLVGFLIVAYLTLVQTQNTLTVRSQAWNSAIPIVEAGIEEALVHLNLHASTNLACDGWTQSGNTYVIQRSLGQNFYYVTITNWVAGGSNNSPIIESSGYVAAPLLSKASPNALLATMVAPDSTIKYLGRGVRARTVQDFIFTKGMVARETIDLMGNNIHTDSFDSTDPLYSTNGLYIASKKKAKGDIACASGITNSINVGNADILGMVSTGPNGSIAIGPQGSVGDLEWQTNGHRGIQAGASKNDMNVSFNDVKVPFSGGYITPGGGWVTNATTLVGTYYDCVLDQNANYQLPYLNGSIYVGAKAVLYVTTTLNVSSLTIKTGKSLNLYSSAPTVQLSGNTTLNSDGTVNSDGTISSDGTADSFGFWGLPTCTSVTFSGNADFTGTIYAPNAAFTLNGSGNEITDFVGASITKTVNMNGHFNFHYDEALAKIGPSRGYVVTSWNEMLPYEVAAAQPQ